MVKQRKDSSLDGGESKLADEPAYEQLLGRISEVYTSGQVRAHQAVNAQITETYWQIGRDIVEFEQGARLGPTTGQPCSPSSVAT